MCEKLSYQGRGADPTVECLQSASRPEDGNARQQRALQVRKDAASHLIDRMGNGGLSPYVKDLGCGTEQ